MFKILHIVEALQGDGRAVLLHELIHHTKAETDHLVITLLNPVTFAHRFTEMGIEVYPLTIYSPFRNLREKRRAIARIFRFRPDICLGWSGD